jgi:hypothetical protein
VRNREVQWEAQEDLLQRYKQKSIALVPL